ncbi:hypothetical protein Tco_1361186 [Tanacetum coccineum]
MGMMLMMRDEDEEEVEEAPRAFGRLWPTYTPYMNARISYPGNEHPISLPPREERVFAFASPQPLVMRLGWREFSRKVGQLAFAARLDSHAIAEGCAMLGRGGGEGLPALIWYLWEVAPDDRFSTERLESGVNLLYKE